MLQLEDGTYIVPPKGCNARYYPFSHEEIVPSPSSTSEECIRLHRALPDLMNKTVNLFLANEEPNRAFDKNYSFVGTCYPAFSNVNSKGWCTIRKSGVPASENRMPLPGYGWGFCSNDSSQDECNGEIKDVEDDTPKSLVFFDNKYCREALKVNLEVEGKMQAGFEEEVTKSETFCVGQTHEHSFENEQFFYRDNSKYTKLENISSAIKV